MPVNRTRRELTEMHTDIVLKHDETAPLVPGLPRCHQPRLSAPGQRRARVVRRIVPAVRPVPRRKIARLARRRAWAPHRQLERRERLPAVRPLPQSAPAAVPRARAQARAAAAQPRHDDERRPRKPDRTTRRLFTAAAARSRRRAWILTACGPKRLYEVAKEPAAKRRRRSGAPVQGRARRGHQSLRCRSAARRGVRVRARHFALHRLPAVRVRLRGGEQPVARPADSLDPRPLDGEGEGRRFLARRPLLQPGRGAARKGTSTCR